MTNNSDQGGQSIRMKMQTWLRIRRYSADTNHPVEQAEYIRDAEKGAPCRLSRLKPPHDLARETDDPQSGIARQKESNQERQG
jgi:hypothetical protein